VTGESHYAEMGPRYQAQAPPARRRQHRWIVVRNRLSMLGSRNKQLVADGLKDLSFRLGFR